SVDEWSALHGATHRTGALQRPRAPSRRHITAQIAETALVEKRQVELPRPDPPHPFTRMRHPLSKEEAGHTAERPASRRHGIVEHAVPGDRVAVPHAGM